MIDSIDFFSKLCGGCYFCNPQSSELSASLVKINTLSKEFMKEYCKVFVNLKNTRA